MNKECKEIFCKIDERFENVDERFNQVDKRFQKVDERFDQVDKRFDEVDARFEKFKAEMYEFKDDMLEFKEFAINKFNEHDILLKEIHRSVLLSEAYLRDKIPTLFDANTVNQEQHENFNDKFNNLESSVEHNSLKISILEDTTNLHSEQLKKLTS